MVKHVVVHNFYGDGYLPFPLCGASAGRRRAVNFRAISNYHLRSLLACKERSDGIASLSSVSHGNPRFPRNSSPKQKNNGQSIDYPLFLVEATGLEPTTSWSLTKRATKLRYASISFNIISLILWKVKHFFIKTQKKYIFLKKLFFAPILYASIPTTKGRELVHGTFILCKIHQRGVLHYAPLVAFLFFNRAGFSLL